MQEIENVLFRIRFRSRRDKRNPIVREKCRRSSSARQRGRATTIVICVFCVVKHAQIRWTKSKWTFGSVIYLFHVRSAHIIIHFILDIQHIGSQRQDFVMCRMVCLRFH